MDFKIQLHDNISDRQARIIKEALQEISSHITDDITVNLAFSNSNALDRRVKGAALPNRMGGLDESKLDYSGSSIVPSYEEFIQGADGDVITLEEFRQALAQDSRSNVDRKFVDSIESNATIGNSSARYAFDKIEGIQLTTANAKAVGLSSADSSSIDGIISLNSRDNFSDAQFKSLVMHEVGHALGFVSAVDSVSAEVAYLTATGYMDGCYSGNSFEYKHAYAETYRINPLDLGRYAEDERGLRIYDTYEIYNYRNLHPTRKRDLSGFNKIYFSVDGGETEVAEFAIGAHYNTSEADEQFYFQGSHWNDEKNQGIMNGGFYAATSFNTFSNADLIAFDAIGYDVNYWGNSSGTVEVVDWNSDSFSDDLGDILELARRGYSGRTASRTASTRTVQSASSTSVRTGYHSIDAAEAMTYQAESSYENYLNELTSQVYDIATDFRVEVSQFDALWNFKARDLGFGSNGQIMDLRNISSHNWGVAKYMVRQSGTYNLYLGGFDEADGKSKVKIKVNDTFINEQVNNRQLGVNWANDKTRVRDKVGTNVVLKAGDEVRIVAQRVNGDLASIDYLDFEAVYENASDSGSNFKLEAESFDLDGYRVESLGSASGGKALSFVGGATNESGFARYTFDTNGTYNISLAAFDENDGQAKIDLRFNGSSIGVMNLDRDLGDYGATGQTLRSETVAREVTVRAGDILTVKGFENAGEHARLDYLEFEALHSDITGAGTSSGSTSKFKLEAESFNLNGYRVENLGSASGGKALSFVGGAGWESGSANYTFDRHGTYDVSLTAFDENDGYAKIDLHLNGSSIGIFNLDQNLGHYGASEQTLRSQTVAYGIDFAPGDVLIVKGYEKAGEHARLDYLEFTPSF